MRERLAPLLLASMFAFILTGCASVPREPFAVIDGTDWDRTDPYSAPVQIASIDGKDYLQETRRALSPGTHTLEFLTTRVTRANRLRERRAITLELKPCVSYYFYAKHPDRYDGAWELKLLREVPLEHCSR